MLKSRLFPELPAEATAPAVLFYRVILFEIIRNDAMSESEIKTLDQSLVSD